MGTTDYRLQQDWKEFAVPGATVIAQASFWLGNCVEDASRATYINGETIPRVRTIPRLRKPEDLEQFVQTQLISNATGNFRYHPNPRQRLRFGQAKDNTDWDFVRALYVMFWRLVMPLNPTRVIDRDGTKRGIILLGMLWLEKTVQIVLRLRQMGMSDERSFGPLIDELQNVYRLREESVANFQGTYVPDLPAANSPRYW